MHFAHMSELDGIKSRDHDEGFVLARFRIGALPPDFYYIPNFITVEEEERILGKIPAQRWIPLTHRRLQAYPSTLTKTNTLIASPLPQWLTHPIIDRFKSLGLFEHTPHQQPNHVLVNEYRAGEGIMPHEDGAAYAGVVATVSLGGAVCLDVMAKVGGEKEEEKEEEEGKVECTSVVGVEASGGARAGKLTTAQNNLPARILQERRSLLITTGRAYEDLLHGITPITVDEQLNADTVANWSLLGDSGVFEAKDGKNERGTRISLTFRDVLKVSEAASKVLGGLDRR
ncbi:hypothetical protein CC80DRAFT_546701 [Byssothecium circinans]|uniref:Fe2OG dioxygenase domain-containing protein n=1 Tax=Byssothecium circinans TaxID=147558 RepID=A0A6A5U3D7_9PLEO|nr:hypothetical protein CC80DRAFT_546701 [Byssothecium circinans]